MSLDETIDFGETHRHCSQCGESLSAVVITGPGEQRGMPCGCRLFFHGSTPHEYVDTADVPPGLRSVAIELLDVWKVRTRNFAPHAVAAATIHLISVHHSRFESYTREACAAHFDCSIQSIDMIRNVILRDLDVETIGRILDEEIGSNLNK